jgi:ABC-type branched-subunit amino acid transport system substrate-binding protein
MPQVVQLVGGGGWNHPTLAIRGGPALQGALVVDAFAGELGGDTGAQFATDFQSRSRRSATAAAAQAFDAATLVARVRRDIANAPDPRAAFRTTLARGKLDDGACGPAAMDVNGELVREPAVLEVQGDQLQLVP